MISLPQNTSVLIVGAGPSGLMMAAQLLRHGVQPVIIDTKKGPTNQSKALVVQARSLEIYRQLGIVDEVIRNGNPVLGAALCHGGAIKASYDLTGIGTGQTPYPFMQLYPQGQNERVLLDFLTRNCCPVYWETSLTSITQNETSADVILQNGGTSYNLTCNWLIGADGAHSTVRKQLAIPFQGETYQHNFYLADVELDNSQLSDSYVQLFLEKKGFAGFFPMPGDNKFRIVGNIPPKLADSKDLKLADVLPHLNEIATYSVDIRREDWFTTYRLHHRMASQFRNQHSFLIGDAAHIHSPVGGQGMNTGLQDAYNLGWKLAAVVNGQITESILNSYAAERMPIAKDLLNSTDRAFSIIMSGNWLVNIFKTWLLPKILNTAWKKERSRKAFFKRISQTGIDYRDSKLNLQLGSVTKIKAGDRLPYLEIFDEKKKTKTDLHAWCSKPGFTLITFGHIGEEFLFAIAKWITHGYGNGVNFFHLPPSRRNRKVFDAFQVSDGGRKVLIIRPDMHIGHINDILDIEIMNNYLHNVVGFIG
jgi:2-polyprenyl-6-methoxyphenol hydroxylase-like FAD-dependent oxidoreductase